MISYIQSTYSVHHQALQIPRSPPALTQYRPDNPAEFKKTQAYNLDKWQGHVTLDVLWYGVLDLEHPHNAQCTLDLLWCCMQVVFALPWPLEHRS
jgi:hypothetical protein